MELMNPIFLYIGIPLFILLFFVLKIKKKVTYTTGKKVANTRHIKEIPLYKELERKYKIIIIIIEIVIFLNIIMCLVLLSRPYKTKTTTNKSSRKDIFLCMDVSTSVAALDYELVDNLKDVVKKLDGERFGISIFNTTTILYVPLTDDYDYVVQKLENLKRPFQLGERDYDYNYGNGELKRLSSEENNELNRFYDGTILDAETRGSSLIGDGLATCLFSFPNMEEERDRIIIFATDNDLAGDEKISLEDAAKLCKDKNIVVYGLAPNAKNVRHIKDAEEKQAKFKSAVEQTNGNFYVQSDNLSVKNIVKDIQNRQRIAVDERTETKKIDTPEVAVRLLLLFSIAMIILLILF